jgi:hypothetical protein
MKLLLAALIGALIGVACTVAYYEWWENEPEEDAVITDQESPPDRPRPIQP